MFSIIIMGGFGAVAAFFELVIGFAIMQSLDND